MPRIIRKQIRIPETIDLDIQEIIEKNGYITYNEAVRNLLKIGIGVVKDAETNRTI